MRTIKAWPAAVLAGLCAAAACAAPATGSKPADSESAPAVEARIPFADHHGIYSWQVLDNRTVLIQIQSRTWYKAKLMSPCIDLPFAERIGFKTNPDGSFDRFGAILVRHQVCPLISLTVTAPPAKKAPHGKPAKPAAPKPEKS